MNNQTTIIVKNLTVIFIVLLSVQFSFAQLRVTKPDGNVGIGLETPNEKLDVNGNISMRGGILRTGNNEWGGSSLQVGKLSNKSGATFIDLHPSAGAPAVGRFISNINPSGLHYSALMHYGDGNLSLRSWNPNASIGFVTTNSDNKPVGALTITPNGNVGIGEVNPQYKLSVKGEVAKYGNDTWIVLSDKRTKKNINTYDLGLSEVLKLNPVTFNYNGKAGIYNTDKIYVGLIAQEFGEIMPNAVSKYIHTDTVANKTEEYLAIDASSVRYMLVNAVKEQQALIELQNGNIEKQQALAKIQQTEIENLKVQIAELAKGSTSTFPTDNEMNVLLEGNGTETGLLSQNSPNPFTTKTRIEYFIPSDSRHCRMSFRDMNGKEIKQVNIKHEGVGAIELSAKDLATGIYSYVLYVNGDIVASKKMILK